MKGEPSETARKSLAMIRQELGSSARAAAGWVRVHDTHWRHDSGHTIGKAIVRGQPRYTLFFGRQVIGGPFNTLAAAQVCKMDHGEQG